MEMYGFTGRLNEIGLVSKACVENEDEKRPLTEAPFQII
jgi:hypothetical protein